MDGLDACASVGVDVDDDALGKKVGEGAFGGSIKLEIDGEALARLTLLTGEMCDVLDGLDVVMVGEGIVADRIGS